MVALMAAWPRWRPWPGWSSWPFSPRSLLAPVVARPGRQPPRTSPRPPSIRATFDA